MTLTDAVCFIRKFVPLAALTCIIFFILFITFKIVEPTRPETPVVALPTAAPAFGQIPAIVLTNASPLKQKMTYTMNTIEGVPLTATASARIYFIPKKTPGLSFREKAGVIAKALKFDERTTTSKYDQKSETYTLVDQNKRLIVNIDTFNYTFTQDITDETKSILSGVVIPTEDAIKAKAQEILRALGRYPSDIAQGSQAVSYISYREASGSAQSTAEVVRDPQSANMVSVEVFPAKIAEFDAVTEGYVSSPNRVVFVPKESETDDFVVKAQIRVFERSEEQFSNYPLKTGEQAFQDLHGGRGWIIQGKEIAAGKTNIGINSMQTSYLIPDAYTQYIQPVYVFIGEDGFVAYVPALLDAWIQGSTFPTFSIPSPTDTVPTLTSTPITSPTVDTPVVPSPTVGITFIPIQKNP